MNLTKLGVKKRKAEQTGASCSEFKGQIGPKGCKRCSRQTGKPMRLAVGAKRVHLETLEIRKR